MLRGARTLFSEESGQWDETDKEEEVEKEEEEEEELDFVDFKRCYEQDKDKWRMTTFYFVKNISLKCEGQSGSKFFGKVFVNTLIDNMKVMLWCKISFYHSKLYRRNLILFFRKTYILFYYDKNILHPKKFKNFIRGIDIIMLIYRVIISDADGHPHIYG